MKAAVAMPPARLSADITRIRPVRSWPRVLSKANNKLLAALKTAPSISTRITPSRMAMAPPMKAPARVMITP